MIPTTRTSLLRRNRRVRLVSGWGLRARERGSIDFAWRAGPAEAAFESRAVPAAGVRGGGVGRLEKREEELVGVGHAPDRLVGQHELAKLRVEPGAGWRRSFAEAGRLGLGVCVERRVRKCVRARPEPGAAHLMRVGFAHDRVRQVRGAAGVGGRAPTREA